MIRLLLDQPDVVGPWVYARFPHPVAYVPGSSSAIGVLLSNKLVAGVTYSQYNGANVWAAISAEPRVRWCSRAVLWVLFDYPFRQLGVKRISIAVDEDNRASQDFVTRLGFRPETRLIEASPGGDLLIYRMRREECPWFGRSPRVQRFSPQPS